jgi:TANFOR domain-containing protein
VNNRNKYNSQTPAYVSNGAAAFDETVRNTIFIASSGEPFRAYKNWIWCFVLTFCFFFVKEKEKKNAKLTFILFFLLQTIICSIPFGEVFGGAYAQTYPVQITTQLTPPFSGYLSDESIPGNENLKVLIYLTDFSNPVYDVKLKIKVEGQGITIQNKPFYYSSAISLVPGQPLQLSGSDLAGLLNSNNLDFSGISKSQYELRKVLPEGYYKICFTAYDVSNPIKVSNESCAMGWMLLNDPPFLNTPICNSTVTITNPQNILFNWTPMNMASPNSAANTEYEFSLYEVRPEGQNPNNIIQTLPPIFTTTVNTPFLNYGITETPLISGMQYVWRVRAIDISGRDLFKNNGYSQICTFNWGTKYDGMGNLDIFLAATPLTHRSAKLVWDSIPIFTNYHLEYRKAGGNWNWMPLNTTNART